MELSQEELDAKLSVAKQEAASAKESEIKAKIEEANRVAEEKVTKMAAESSRKVSEQSQELGELRKFKTETEPKLQEVTTLREKLSLLEGKATGDPKGDGKGDKPPEPSQVLETITEAEAKKIDEIYKSKDCPKIFKDAVTKGGADKDKAIAEALLGLRDSAPSDVVNAESPAMSIFKTRENSKIDAVSIRSTIAEQLKQHTKQSTKTFALGGPQVLASGKEAGTQVSSLGYGTSLRSVAETSK